MLEAEHHSRNKTNRMLKGISNKLVMSSVLPQRIFKSKRSKWTS